MVLSLGFIIAFIGAAVALLIGILIFSEVEDAIICPAGSGGSDFINSLSADEDELNGRSGGWVGQILPTTGQSLESVTVNNMDIPSSAGTVKSQIWTGATTDIDTSTFIQNSSNTLVISGAGDYNFTWTYSPAVTVSDSDTFIAFILENLDSDVLFPLTDSDVIPGDAYEHSSIETGGFILWGGGQDLLMQVTQSGGGAAGQGSEECQNAKDTAWTVIGILPVALFFALFAIFGALGRQN